MPAGQFPWRSFWLHKIWLLQACPLLEGLFGVYAGTIPQTVYYVALCVCHLSAPCLLFVFFLSARCSLYIRSLSAFVWVYGLVLAEFFSSVFAAWALLLCLATFSGQCSCLLRVRRAFASSLLFSPSVRALCLCIVCVSFVLCLSVSGSLY